jgi:hypothetical protein
LSMHAPYIRSTEERSGLGPWRDVGALDALIARGAARVLSSARRE